MISHALETRAVKYLGVVFVFLSRLVKEFTVQEGCLFNLLTALGSAGAGCLSKATCFLLQMSVMFRWKLHLFQKVLEAWVSY